MHVLQLSLFWNLNAQPASGVFSAALAEALQCVPAKQSFRKHSRKRPRIDRAAVAAPVALCAAAIELLRGELPAVASAVLASLSAPLDAATHMRRAWRQADMMGRISNSDITMLARTLSLALAHLQPSLHAAAVRGTTAQTRMSGYSTRANRARANACWRLCRTSAASRALRWLRVHTRLSFGVGTQACTRVPSSRAYRSSRRLSCAE